MTQDHRDNNFDFLRVAAALAVLVSHQFALSGLPEPLLPTGSWGGTGVLVFFAISGYLVAASWQNDPHLGRFLLRRLLRIWPGLAVALALIVLVLGPLVSSLDASAYFNAPETWRYLRQLGLWRFKQDLPGVFQGNPIPGSANGSLWTIPVEVKCYLILALLGLVGLMRWRWAMPLAFLPAAVWFFFLSGIGYDQPIRMKLQMGVVFFAGACMGQLRGYWQDHRPMATLLTALAVAGLWFCGWREIAATLGLPVLVLLFGTASTPVLRRTGRFGDVSYGLYIYAFPVQQTVIWLSGNAWPLWAGLLVSTLVTLALAWLSWTLVEQPALRLKPRRAQVRSRQDVAASASAG